MSNLSITVIYSAKLHADVVLGTFVFPIKLSL